MVKAEYNVTVPRKLYGLSEYATAFWDFYDSDKKNVRYTYETLDRCLKARKSFDMLILRKNIYNVRVTRRGKDLYLIKED